MMTGVMDEDERLKLTPEQELKAILFGEERAALARLEAHTADFEARLRDPGKRADGLTQSLAMALERASPSELAALRTALERLAPAKRTSTGRRIVTWSAVALLLVAVGSGAWLSQQPAATQAKLWVSAGKWLRLGPTPASLTARVAALESNQTAEAQRMNAVTAGLSRGFVRAEEALAREIADLAAAVSAIEERSLTEAGSAASVEEMTAALSLVREDLQAVQDAVAAVASIAVDKDTVAAALEPFEQRLESLSGALAGADAALSAETSRLDAALRETARRFESLGESVAANSAARDAERQRISSALQAVPTDRAEALAALKAELAAEAAVRQSTVAAALNDVEALIATTETRLGQRNQELGAAQTAVIEALQSEVGRLAEAMPKDAAAQADLAALQSEVQRVAEAMPQDTVAQADLAALKAEMQSLKAAVADAMAAASQSGRSAQLKQAIPDGTPVALSPNSSLQQRVGDLEQASIAALGTLDEQMQALSRQIGDLRAHEGGIADDLENTRIALEADLAQWRERQIPPIWRLSANLAGRVVQFSEGDRYAESAQAEALLRTVAAWLLEAGSDIGLRIVGYTDFDGSGESSNRITSQKRANAIRDALVRLGIPAERLVAVGRSTEDRAVNDDSSGNANRRVAFEPFFLANPAP